MPIAGIQFRKESTGQWVDADARDPNDEDGIRLLGAGKTGVIEVLYVDIPGNSWNQNRLNKFADRANEVLTYRQPLADLPADDPDKTTDPNNFPILYWDGSDLCSRVVTISNVTYSAEKGLSFRIQREN